MRERRGDYRTRPSVSKTTFHDSQTNHLTALTNPIPQTTEKTKGYQDLESVSES